MIELRVETGRGSRLICHQPGFFTIDQIWEILELKGFSRDAFAIQKNGRPLPNHLGALEGCVTMVPRLCGGKGGFGSMLRAIGAQIEKTTNREACRDLSGRRLRDINEEKRLKAWIEKQESREEEEVERKKRKLAKLCAVPKHEFKDKKYEEERSGLTDKVADSVEEGFKMAAATAVACAVEKKIELGTKRIKRKTILDDDFDSDDLEDSEDSEFENEHPAKRYATGSSNSDSGCSSEVSRKACAGSDRGGDETSRSSCSDQVADFKDESNSNETENPLNLDKNPETEPLSEIETPTKVAENSEAEAPLKVAGNVA